MRRVPIYVLIASLVLSPSSAHTWAQQIPREFGAAGQPIFDADDCDGAADRVNRMARGLPDQNASIRTLEAKRDAARQASEAAGAQATDRVRDALLDQVKGKLTDAAKDYVKGTEQFKKAAEFVDDKASELGITEANKTVVSKAYELAEERAAVWKSFNAGSQGGRELMQANRNLLDDAMSLNKVFVDSTIADKTFDVLTDYAMKNPVTAPPAVIAKAARVLIDVAVATGESGIEGRYAVNLDNELNVLRDVRTKMENRITTLKTRCLNPKQQQKAEQERQKGEREVARQEPANQPTQNSSVGKIVGWTALLGGSAVAGAYAAAQTELETSTSSPNRPTTTNNNNPAPVSNTPATIGLGAFSCSRANDTSNFRSCTGSINVRAGTLIGARQGATLSAVTQPSVFVGRFTAPASGGTTGTVELRATVASCPIQTAILFTADGTVFFESIAVTIPVSCP